MAFMFGPFHDISISRLLPAINKFVLNGRKFVTNGNNPVPNGPIIIDKKDGFILLIVP